MGQREERRGKREEGRLCRYQATSRRSQVTKIGNRKEDGRKIENIAWQRVREKRTAFNIRTQFVQRLEWFKGLKLLKCPSH
jgi:hypothetical protein